MYYCYYTSKYPHGKFAQLNISFYLRSSSRLKHLHFPDRFIGRSRLQMPSVFDGCNPVKCILHLDLSISLVVCTKFSTFIFS